MTDKTTMPSEIWLKDAPVITERSFGLPVKDHIKYTLVHNNPEYHVIKKSDVDGDVMGALDELIEVCYDNRLYGTATPNGQPYDPDASVKRLRAEIRNALIAQSDPDIVRMNKLEGALEDAITGIQWWIDNNPNEDTRADEEKLTEFRALLNYKDGDDD